MRRIRTSEPGAAVLFERETNRRGALRVDHQIALDTDVRKLLDRVRVRLGDQLRGVSTPELERHWSMQPIEGGPALASTTIELTSNGGAAYLGRVADGMAAEVVPAVIREWLSEAVPKSGEVRTEPTPNTAPGPIPSSGKR